MGSVPLGIAVLLASALVLLAVPVTLLFRIDRTTKVEGQLSFRWLFGLVRFRVGIPGDTEPEARRKRGSAKQGKQRRAGASARGVVRLLKRADFRRHAFRFIRSILRATHARGLYLRLRIGLGDPADTGRLWALLGPVAGIAANLRSAEVRIDPEFMDPAFEVESRGELRLVPLQLIALVVAFVASPTTFRAWRVLRQGAA